MRFEDLPPAGHAVSPFCAIAKVLELASRDGRYRVAMDSGRHPPSRDGKGELTGDIESPDWGSLSHAYGPASDTPIHLSNLLAPYPADQEAALDHLWGAVHHQETIYPVTAPAAVQVSRLLGDPRTMKPVKHWTDLNHQPRLLRESLLDFLASVADSAAYVRPGTSYALFAEPQNEEVERIVARMWRGDFDFSQSDAVVERAGDVYMARAVLNSRLVLPEIAPRVLAQMTSSDSRVRQSAANAAAKFANAMADQDFKRGVLSTLETMALNANTKDRAALVLAIGELGGEPRTFLNDPEFVVRSCAALAPALAQDPIATALILQAVERSIEIDRLTDGIPQFGMRARYSFVKAAVERAASFEALLPGALAVASVSNAHSVENDIGPLLSRAFPEPYRPDHSLSPSQRAFLRALVSNEEIWSKVLGNPIPWFLRVGLSYDREACHRIAAKT